MLAWWQSKGEATPVTDQSGRDAEQFVAQPGAMSAAVIVDPGECLEEDREIPGEQRGPRPDLVDAVVSRGQVTQGGTELGLMDPVLDVGTAPEPRLHVADRLAVAGVVVGGDEGGR